MCVYTVALPYDLDLGLPEGIVECAPDGQKKRRDCQQKSHSLTIAPNSLYTRRLYQLS